MDVDHQGGLWIKNTEGRINHTNVEVIKDLHERYGHISFDTLSTLPEYPKGHNIKPWCKACEKGKATKPPSLKQLSNQAIRTSRPLKRLHADLVGPIEPVTPGNQYKYFLVVTDDFSRYVITKPLQKKNDATEALIEIISILEKATNN